MAKKIISGWAIIAIIAIVWTISILLSAEAGADRVNCPYSIEGNASSDFTIKYVDSPYCMWCWIEEPILTGLLNDHKNELKLEKYDIRYCQEIVRKHKLRATPSFVFSINETEYAHIGFLKEKQLNAVICEVTGC